MTEINVTLTIAEVNQILEALGQLPYSKVYQLVSKIQEQASNQLNAIQGQVPQPGAED
jgi:hypothetical protein